MDKIISYIPAKSDIMDNLKFIGSESEKIRKIVFSFDRCPENNDYIEVTPANLNRLRGLFGVGAAGAGIVGLKVLPFIGFDITGVLPNSIAAGIQAGIGNVSAGSYFAIIQSLGATGIGKLLFGGAAVGLTGLAGLVTEKKLLNWCTCQYEQGKYENSKL